MRSRNPQRGSAMLVTLILISSLLAGAAVLVSMQLASTRSSDVTRTGMSATYCAEAGLSIARPIVIANYSGWGPALAASAASIGSGATPVESAFITTNLTPAQHDLDGDSVPDFYVYIKDNDDELTSPNNLAADNDLRIFIVSRCTKYGETVKEVEELIKYTGGGTGYQSQAGGISANGNSN
jgi:hypothetical protein